MLSTITKGFADQFCVPAHIQGGARVDQVREKIIEALGSVLGMGGAVWLALRIDGFAYAYILFLASSVLLVRHFYRKQQGWMMIQQAVFAVINVSGIYCWIFQPLS